MTATTDRQPVSEAQRPPSRGGLHSVLLVIGVVVLLIGGLSLVSMLLRSSESETLQFADAVTAVQIDADAGSIDIVGTDGEGAEVTVTREWGLGGRPAVDAEVVNGTLRLRGDCSNRWRSWWIGTCSTAFVVSAPRGVSVVVSTEAGSVDVRDVDSGADVTTSAGSITLTGVSGPVALRTSAGSIEAEVASTQVDAVTSAGSVTITDTVVPDSIVARSSAGAVEVTVPDEVYRVEATTSAGNQTVDVATSPDSSRLISVTSSAGNVTVRRHTAR
jgi:hypothetical protein